MDSGFDTERNCAVVPVIYIMFVFVRMRVCTLHRNNGNNTNAHTMNIPTYPTMQYIPTYRTRHTYFIKHSYHMYHALTMVSLRYPYGVNMVPLWYPQGRRRWVFFRSVGLRSTALCPQWQVILTALSNTIPPLTPLVAGTLNDPLSLTPYPH